MSKKPDVAELTRELGMYSEAEVAAIMGIKIETLRNRASRGDAPPFISMGRRKLYPIEEFKRWMARRRST